MAVTVHFPVSSINFPQSLLVLENSSFWLFAELSSAARRPNYCWVAGVEVRITGSCRTCASYCRCLLGMVPAGGHHCVKCRRGFPTGNEAKRSAADRLLQIRVVTDFHVRHILSHVFCSKSTYTDNLSVRFSFRHSASQFVCNWCAVIFRVAMILSSSRLVEPVTPATSGTPWQSEIPCAKNMATSVEAA